MTRPSRDSLWTLPPARPSLALSSGMHEADFQAVSPGYFTTLGIPLLRGRKLSATDLKTTMSVAIVSEAFERKLLGGSSAIGARFS